MKAVLILGLLLGICAVASSQDQPTKIRYFVDDPEQKVEVSVSPSFYNDESYGVPLEQALKLMTHGKGSFLRTGNSCSINFEGRKAVIMPFEEPNAVIKEYAVTYLDRSGSVLMVQKVGDVPHSKPGYKGAFIDLETLAGIVGATVQIRDDTVSIYTKSYWADQIGLDHSETVESNALDLVPEFGISPPSNVLLLWVKPRRKSFVQIYKLSSGRPEPMLGQDEMGNRVFLGRPAVFNSVPASPSAPVRGQTEAIQHREDITVSYVAFLSTKDLKGMQPDVAIDNGTLKAGDWTVVGLVQRFTNRAMPLHFNSYTVQRGDTVASLSSRFDMVPELFAQLNGIDPAESLQPGSPLVYLQSVEEVQPEGYKVVGMYVTRPNDSLDTLAEKWHVTRDNLVIADPELDTGTMAAPGMLISEIGPETSPTTDNGIQDIPIETQAVTLSAVKMYQSPDTTSDYTTIPAHKTVNIFASLAKEGFWGVEFADRRGYVARSDLAVNVPSKPQQFKDLHDLSPVANEALKFVGMVGYHYGGSSLSKGIDCSNFVAQIFNRAHAANLCPPPPVVNQEKYGAIVQMNRNAGYARRNGHPIDLTVGPFGWNQVRVGARVIIQYANSDAPKTRHTGIYLGEGRWYGRNYHHAFIECGNHGVLVLDILNAFGNKYKYCVYGRERADK